MTTEPPADAIAFPSHPGVSLWQCLEQAAGMGRAVVLSVEQQRELLADHARLTEKANDLTRDLYGVHT